MVRSETPEQPGGEQTLGDLVSLATRDISQLVRYELNLAKAELRGEVRRAAAAGVLFGIAAFFVCLMLFSGIFAYAYLLHWAGAWGGMGGAFGFVCITLAVLGAVLVFIARMVIHRMTGMKKTRESVSEDIGMLRRDGKDGNALSPSDSSANGQGPKTASTPLPDGRRPEIADHSPR
jgi:ABC-type multidrug transport system fused ATPase/permease subunit